MRRAATLALGAVGVLTGVARAEAPAADPEPVVTDAGDANLESTALRRGVTFAIVGGGGLTLPFGINDSVGRGGALALRLGHVASPRTLVTIEFDGIATLHGIGSGATERTFLNNDANFLVGGQFYVNTSLWLRAALGLGIYNINHVDDTSTRMMGPAGGAGVGVDLARWRHVVIDLEALTAVMISRHGMLSTTTFALGVSFQ